VPSASKIYAIVLTFKGNIEKVITRLFTSYGPYFQHAIVPHITLVYPFTPVFSLYKIYEQLEKVARQTAPFPVTLNRIKYFEGENNVAYAALGNKRPVRKLHIALTQALEGVIQPQNTESRFILERFMPHVTLASLIPDEVLPELQKKLSKYHLHYEDRVTEFSLYAEINGAWQRKRVFALSG
jgi:2'-5' RNA ligase